MKKNKLAIWRGKNKFLSLIKKVRVGVEGGGENRILIINK